jgi:hypothetical protein
LISVVWGGVDYPITQPYGPNHRGIDIGCPTGTQLYAARAGTVTTAAYWGVAIKVDGTNQTDWYLHIKTHSVNGGQHVKRGQAVATVDTTPVPGGPLPTGPHLHFEVQTGQLDVYATSLDPVTVLDGTYGASGGIIGGDFMANVSQLDADVLLWTVAIMSGRETLATAPAALQSYLAKVITPSVEPPDAPGGAVDLSSVLGAIAALAAAVAVIEGDVATVKRLVEKDLAP